MKTPRRLLIAMLLLAVAIPVAAQQNSAGGPLAEAIDAACERVVKLYGGGFGRERGYGSGVLVSADGRIVTTLSVLLESPTLRAVLADGRRFPAQVVKRDEQRQLALLQIEADGLPFFELDSSRHLQTGDWVVAVANPFKVADGPEPASVAVGVLSGRAELSARRYAQDFAYEGPVLLTDVIVATPGSAGGALVDAQGRLVGLIGKAVISKRTNTWANYALPTEQVAAFVRGPVTAETPNASPDAATGRDAGHMNRALSASEGDETIAVSTRPYLGIRLFDVGGRTRPAYVERVRPDSPAWAAGLRPNDLILSLSGEPIGTCDDFYRVRDGLRAGQQATIVVKRGEELKSLNLTVGERER